MSGEFLPLEALGPRIIILGASNAGKSTLAHAIFRITGLTPVFLDRMRFEPHSDWVERPVDDFVAEHDAAILAERWVCEGNYSFALPQRFARATGVIVLWDRRWPAFYRYVRRTLFERGRLGSIDGDRDSLKWLMIHWILVVQPARRAMYEKLAADSGLPLVRAFGMKEINALYSAWGLARPS